ncbi:vanadium-dependent haloperoxidase [Actinoplanes sp. KI2]|uniref:vanadium-dependent haloperoxidase n=1 Tax=Actinoplanes sp. KI2 TaxID=2983315 RepID=UPI0021D583B2|nr:vanadium-dependent haloperoxidase [Actinoplanes sp. KI2]MCU7729533.1 vanadium-dependent haloperoxidase [Actinoplanes sp. KI2]
MAASLLATGTSAQASDAQEHNPGPRGPMNADGRIVVEWNKLLLTIVRTPGLQPATVHPTRSFAMTHLAMRDAILSRDRRTSPVAAAAQAAHDVLVALYPSQAGDLDARLVANLIGIPDDARRRGIRAGMLAAAAILRARAGDGSDVTPPRHPAGTMPGQWRPAPPAFAAAAFTHWPAVKPFVITSAQQFRPAAYPSLNSRIYAAATDEVRLLGQDTSTARTPEQTQQAKFWAAPIWNYWNEITQGLTTRHNLGVDAAAQVFARLGVTLADSVVAFYEAKYHYSIWRPVTAIQQAVAGGDPTWLPLANTPADPSYPGAHSVVSQAAAVVLSKEFGSHPSVTVTSEALPGITRSFGSLQNIADEAGLSRIFAGVHTRLDHTSGQTLGQRLAVFAERHTR